MIGWRAGGMSELTSRGAGAIGSEGWGGVSEMLGGGGVMDIAGDGGVADVLWESGMRPKLTGGGVNDKSNDARCGGEA